MDDAATGREPLGVAAAEAGCRTERVGVVDEATAHVRDRLEAAMGMAREPGHAPAVVHPPPVDAGEVLPELAPGEARPWSALAVAARVGVVVVDAEQERVDRRPLEPERDRLDHGVGHVPTVSLLAVANAAARRLGRLTAADIVGFDVEGGRGRQEVAMSEIQPDDDPIGLETPEADAIEQRLAVEPTGHSPRRIDRDLETPEADAIDQQTELPPDLDER